MLAEFLEVVNVYSVSKKEPDDNSDNSEKNNNPGHILSIQNPTEN